MSWRWLPQARNVGFLIIMAQSKDVGPHSQTPKVVVTVLCFADQPQIQKQHKLLMGRVGAEMGAHLIQLRHLPK